jgi:uncharacterized protein YjbI with pentapeptide repeats
LWAESSNFSGANLRGANGHGASLRWADFENANLAPADAIQFYSCFISYSTQDQEFAQRLHADLQAKNLRCWFAPEDLKIGDRFQGRIEESIRHMKVKRFFE